MKSLVIKTNESILVLMVLILSSGLIAENEDKSPTTAEQLTDCNDKFKNEAALRNLCIKAVAGETDDSRRAEEKRDSCKEAINDIKDIKTDGAKSCNKLQTGEEDGSYASCVDAFTECADKKKSASCRWLTLTKDEAEESREDIEEAKLKILETTKEAQDDELEKERRTKEQVAEIETEIGKLRNELMNTGPNFENVKSKAEQDATLVIQELDAKLQNVALQLVNLKTTTLKEIQLSYTTKKQAAITRCNGKIEAEVSAYKAERNGLIGAKKFKQVTGQNALTIAQVRKIHKDSCFNGEDYLFELQRIEKDKEISLSKATNSELSLNTERQNIINRINETRANLSEFNNRAYQQMEVARKSIIEQIGMYQNQLQKLMEPSALGQTDFMMTQMTAARKYKELSALEKSTSASTGLLEKDELDDFYDFIDNYSKAESLTELAEEICCNKDKDKDFPSLCTKAKKASPFYRANQ
ncbi:MAG: hypothetical protein AB8E15_07405 [Bdellovibrionales bacterium]